MPVPTEQRNLGRIVPKNLKNLKNAKSVKHVQKMKNLENLETLNESTCVLRRTSKW